MEEKNNKDKVNSTSPGDVSEPASSPASNEYSKASMNDNVTNTGNDKNSDDSAVNQNINQANNQVKKLEEQVAELENNWKRALADYKNLERRTAEERAEFAELANMVLIQRLLPVIDNLEMLEKHVNDTGLKMIVKEFKQILEDSGLTAIESDGKQFDSQTMDCVETLECEKEDHDKVLETTTRGYKFKNKVLRPAKVRVGKAKV